MLTIGEVLSAFERGNSTPEEYLNSLQRAHRALQGVDHRQLFERDWIMLAGYAMLAYENELMCDCFRNQTRSLQANELRGIIRTCLESGSGFAQEQSAWCEAISDYEIG